MPSPTPGPRRSAHDFGTAFTSLLKVADVTVDELLEDLPVHSVVTRSTLYDWKKAAHLPGNTDQFRPVVQICLNRTKRGGRTPPDGLVTMQDWLDLLADAKQDRDNSLSERSRTRRNLERRAPAEDWNRSHPDPYSTLMELQEKREDSPDWRDIEAVTAFAAEIAEYVRLDNPGDLAALLGALRDEVGATDAVAALLKRDFIGQLRMDRLEGVHYLLKFLREEDAADQIKKLLARDPASHIRISDPYGVSNLLTFLQEEGATDQIAKLLKRDPAAHATLNEGVEHLLDALQKVGATDQVAELATRAANKAPLDNPYNVAAIVLALAKVSAHEQLARLLNRNPAQLVGLHSTSMVARLLRALMQVDAGGQISKLLERDPAAHVRLELTDLDGDHFDGVCGAESLLMVLRELGEADQVDTLAARLVMVVAGFKFSDPDRISRLVVLLRKTGASGQAAELLDRFLRSRGSF